MKRAALALAPFVLLVPFLSAQTLPQPQSSASVWDVLVAPSMDPEKSAVAENLDIVRDRVHITLVSGTIRFAKPVNGVVFAAIFHGEGKVRLDPPNATEARQIYLFTRQEKLDLSFSDATFSSTDGLFEEIAKQVKWRPGGASDDLYAKRQQERESLGAEQLPRLFKSVMSPDRKRTGYFLADLKSKDKSWIEICDDAMQPEETSGSVGGCRAVQDIRQLDNIPRRWTRSTSRVRRPCRQDGLSDSELPADVHRYGGGRTQRGGPYHHATSLFRRKRPAIRVGFESSARFCEG